MYRVYFFVFFLCFFLCEATEFRRVLSTSISGAFSVGFFRRPLRRKGSADCHVSFWLIFLPILFKNMSSKKKRLKRNSHRDRLRNGFVSDWTSRRPAAANHRRAITAVMKRATDEKASATAGGRNFITQNGSVRRSGRPAGGNESSIADWPRRAPACGQSASPETKRQRMESNNQRSLITSPFSFLFHRLCFVFCFVFFSYQVWLSAANPKTDKRTALVRFVLINKDNPIKPSKTR